MVIKWMECRVKDGMNAAFSAAQEQWRSLAGTPGFIAQTGGWDMRDQNQACIVAFWENEQALSRFMERQHDTIFNRNQQKDTYESISISHFNTLFDMEGSAVTLLEAIHKGKILRTADNLLLPGREEHFETAQQFIWKPAMQKAKGMLGGCFSKDDNSKEPRYLVTTFWDKLENHENYRKHKLAGLQQKANITADLRSITGRLIQICESWCI